MPRPGAQALEDGARRHCHVIGAIAFHQSDRPDDYVGLQPTIGIREKNPIARSHTGAEMASVTLAEPTVRQYVHPLDVYTRILLRQPLEDFVRSVSRSLVQK